MSLRARVCLRPSSGQPSCSPLRKADAWSEWVIYFMRSVLLEAGHFPKALAIFPLSFPPSPSSLSLFPPASFKLGNQYSSVFPTLLFYSRPTYSAYLHHLWASQITDQIGCSAFLSPRTEIRLGEGWPWALADFQELNMQEIIGDTFSPKHAYSKIFQDFEVSALRVDSK